MGARYAQTLAQVKYFIQIAQGQAVIWLLYLLTEKLWPRTMASESAEMFSQARYLARTLALAVRAVKPRTSTLAYHADKRFADSTCASLTSINLQALHKITNFPARLDMIAQAGTASGDRFC